MAREEIRERLLLIFPEATQKRSDVTNLIAASTVFVALYIGATENGEALLQPKAIYRMTGEQAAKTDTQSRVEYIAAIRSPRGEIKGKRWYQDNTRESIRDDTIREGLVQLGAIAQKAGVAVTANKPRYVLTSDFAALFSPDLKDQALEAAVEAWRAKALSPSALARLALARHGATASSEEVLITFPNGETRRMKRGPSTPITKAVIETFAPRFLGAPAIIAVSDSGNKVVELDHTRAKAAGLNIQANQDLPDIILVDLAPTAPLLVFVEVVATDGPVSERRKQVLQDIIAKAGFAQSQVAFVTAYADRDKAAFRKTVSSLAWGSYAWFASEPDGIIELTTTRKTLTN